MNTGHTTQHFALLCLRERNRYEEFTERDGSTESFLQAKCSA